jgi:hypothetical protein
MTSASWRKFSVLAVFLVAIAALPACEEEGPVEEAGEAVDEAGENAGDAVEDAGEEAE